MKTTGLLIIFAGIIILLVACIIYERKKRNFWFCEWKKTDKERYDFRRQLADERKYTKALKAECDALKENQFCRVCEGWKPIYVDERKHYIEKDGIRLIIEDGKCVGWYKP